MHRTSTVFLLMLSSIGLTAQTVTPAAQFTLPVPTVAQSCPVSLTVDRRPEGAVVWTNSSNFAHHGQGLTLSFAKATNPIVAVDVVVHGYSAGTHVFPATANSSNEVTETFHLTASADHPLTDSAIWTKHMASVNRIELTQIQYADGTAWRPSATSHCTAFPSLLVLVNSVAR